jgi:hypothetical protein
MMFQSEGRIVQRLVNTCYVSNQEFGSEQNYSPCFVCSLRSLSSNMGECKWKREIILKLIWYVVCATWYFKS